MKTSTGNVQLLIEATDKASEVFHKTGVSMDEMQGAMKKVADAAKTVSKETDKTESGIKRFSGSINQMVQGLTGFNLQTLSAAGAVVALGKAAIGSVKEYYDYTVVVQKMADATGMATDEISKIIQVADDFRVSQSSVETAIKMALQNGVNPSIDSLAKLADRYNEIVDPTQRADEMQKIFGRSWIELTPLLAAGGDAIRQSAAAMSDGLVVTEKAADQAKEYYVAMDTLNDSITGVKYTMARDFIPVLTDLIKTMNTLLSYTDQVNSVLADHESQVSDSAKTYYDYYTEMERSYKMTGKILEITQDEVKVWQLTSAGMVEVTALYPVKTREQWAAEQATKAEAEAAGALNERLERMGSWQEVAAQKAEMLMDAVTGVGTQTTISAMAMENYLKSIDNVTGATELAKVSQQKFTKELFLQQAMLGLSTPAQIEFAKAMGMVDEKTAYALQRLQAIKEEYAQTGNLDVYLQKTRDLGAALGALQSRKVIIDIYYNEHGGRPGRYGGPVDENGSSYVPPPPNPTDLSKTVEPTIPRGGTRVGGAQYASGGWFMIPPGYPNDSFYLGGGHWAQSGEKVTITPPNKRGEGQGGNSYVFNIFTQENPGQVKNAITLSLSRLMGGAA